MRLGGQFTVGQNARYIAGAQGQFPYECANGCTTEEYNLNVSEAWG